MNSTLRRCRYWLLARCQLYYVLFLLHYLHLRRRGLLLVHRYGSSSTSNGSCDCLCTEGEPTCLFDDRLIDGLRQAVDLNDILKGQGHVNWTKQEGRGRMYLL